MNAWETLAADCDQAIERCGFCRRYGHSLSNCPGWPNSSDHDPEGVNEAIRQQLRDEAEPVKEYSGYLVTSWLLFMAVLGGTVWYGAVRLVAWALRALGVHITGI
jgi:hypothetical protein